jgi:hypothetical protein
LILLITMVPPTYWERKNQRTTGPGYLDKWESQNCCQQFWSFQAPQIITGFMKEPAGYGWLFNFVKFWGVGYLICFWRTTAMILEGNFAQFLIGKCPSPTKLFCFFEW